MSIKLKKRNHLFFPKNIFTRNIRTNTVLDQHFNPKNIKHLSILIIVSSFLIFIDLIACSYLNGQLNHKTYASNENDKPKISTENKQAEFASNEILIKVKKGARNKIREGDPLNTGFESLNKIHRSIKAKKFEKVVRESAKSDKSAEIFSWYKVTINKNNTVIKSNFSELSKLIAQPHIIKKSINNSVSDLDNLVDVISQLRKDPNIEQVEPNFIVQATQIATPQSSFSASSTPIILPLLSLPPSISPSTSASISPSASLSPAMLVSNVPNDPYYSSSGSWGQSYPDMWGLKKINVEGAWKESTGSASIIVAIIDTGVDYNHPDIAANMWQNPHEIAGNGIDDDSNGYVDDVRGWNFVNNTNDPMDDYGHGTHVAGIVGAVGNNGLGVVGVNWNVKIMPVKFLDQHGFGKVDDGAKAIRYAVDNGAKVINNSWGGAFYSQELHDAIVYAHDKGAVIVAAAGNYNINTSFFAPANEPDVITVAASDTNDLKAWFSDYGPKIDVAAPGVDILSLKAANSLVCTVSSGTDPTVGTNYCRLSGTSMATPHVAGLAALILSKHPEFSNEDIRQVLHISADDIEVPGFDLSSGFGRINAAKAMQISSVLSVAITSPNPSGQIDLTGKQTLDIYGTATGSNFASYQLAYSDNSSSQAPWKPIVSTSTTPVTNGLLASWNLPNLSGYKYLIKLTATDTSGRNFDSYMQAYNNPNVKIITQSNTAANPSVFGNYIVYQDIRDKTNWQIYLYDKTSGVEKQITNDNWDHMQPRIYGNNIVWTDFRNGAHIYLYDLTNGSQRQISNGFGEQDPDINNNVIVFAGSRDASGTQGSDIFMFDLLTNIQTQITNDQIFKDHPRVSNSKIVYEAWAGFPYVSAYLYDINAKNNVKLNATGTNGHLPEIWQNNVVWDTFQPTNTSPINIVFYNLSNNSTTTINPDNVFELNPVIFADNIAYEYSRDLFSEFLYFYNLTNKTNIPITLSPWLHVGLQISATNAVWQDYGQCQPITLYCNIYLYQIPATSTTTQPPSISPVSDQSIYVAQNSSLTVSATDVQGLPITLTASNMPTGAIFSDHGNGFGVFSWTPAWGQAGTYKITFNATNGFKNSNFSVNVTAVNPFPPTTLTIKSPDVNGSGHVDMADINAVRNAFGTNNTTYDLNGDGKVTVSDILLTINDYGLNWPPNNLPEGKKIEFFIIGNDPANGKPVSINSPYLPFGATLTNPDGNVEKNRRYFEWTPDYGQGGGTYKIIFNATGGSSPASLTFNIGVLDVPIAITSFTTSYSCNTCLAFKPSLGQSASASFSINHRGFWQIEITDSSGNFINVYWGNYSGSGTVSQVWDGNNARGIVNPGQYTLTLTAQNSSFSGFISKKTATLVVQ